MKLEVRELTKQYPHKTALDHVSFTLEEGVYGLLGPNGAGENHPGQHGGGDFAAHRGQRAVGRPRHGRPGPPLPGGAGVPAPNPVAVRLFPGGRVFAVHGRG